MAHKKTTHSHTILLLLITLACICPIVNATQTLPQDPNNPYNNYTICSTDPYIAYTELFLQSHPNNIYPTIEFGGLFYLNDKLNLTIDNSERNRYFSPLYRYVGAQRDNLIENPNSKIILKLENCEPIEIATSYTDRDKFSNYPGDRILAANTHRGPNEPKPDDEITVYLHMGNLQKYYYQIHHNNLKWFKIENPKYPDYSINPIFGQETLTKYSTQFILSQHYNQYITKKQDTLYYKNTPNITTIIDYIFTQTPQLINNPYSKIYLNIRDNGYLLNREVITYSKELTPDEIIQYQDTISFPTQKSIATNLHSLPNKDILIEKTPENNKQIGVFINTKNLKKLEPKLESQFYWISTYNINKDDSYWFSTSNGWLDTIYEIKQPYMPEPYP